MGGSVVALAPWSLSTLLLLSAHTDTTGAHGVNQRLARERSHAVTRLLQIEGGIPSSRMFVAEEPKKNLPRVTADNDSNDENRVVNLSLVVTEPLKIANQ